MIMQLYIMKIQDTRNIKVLLKKYTKLAFDLGLVWGTSGNMSARVDADSFFITATGNSLLDISLKELILCRINNDPVNNKASSEWRLHSEVYRNRNDAHAVFHSQPPYTTLIACAKNKIIRTALIPETVAYIEKIKVIPYCHAGSIDLAKKCGKGAIEADVLLLENHGLVTFGASIEDAVNKTLTFEYLCRLTVIAKTAGIELKVIQPRQAGEFLRLLGGRKKV